MSEPLQLAQVPGAPLLPQVNLLPPSVRAKRKVAFARIWLALAVLIVIFLTVVAAVATLFEKKQAESDLVDIQDSNQALRAEQEKFAEVPLVLNELDALKEARTTSMSTEMLWSDYLAAISAATPLDASIDVLSVAQDTVFGGTQSQVYGPLSTPGTVGQVSLNGRAMTLDAVSQWEENLAAIPGIADVEVSSIAVADDNGTIHFAVGASFKLTADAFANQFVTEE